MLLHPVTTLLSTASLNVTKNAEIIDMNELRKENSKQTSHGEAQRTVIG